MNSFIKGNKSLSPRSLPKLQPLKPGKVLKEPTPELGVFTSNSSNHLFLELEKKLLEQQKEIFNRDTAVQKVICNFENIIEAHHDQKTKISKIKEKYSKAKKEILSLKEMNIKLNEIIVKGAEPQVREVEEKFKAQLEAMAFALETKNSELQEKQNSIFELETDNNVLKREINKVQSKNADVEIDIPAFSVAEFKSLQEKSAELEQALKNKDEELTIAHNQIQHFKETTSILNAELKTAKFTLNNLKKKHFKATEAIVDEEDLRSSKHSFTKPSDRSFSKPSEDPSEKLRPGSSFCEDPEKPLKEKLKLLKEIQDLSETVMKLKESDMLQSDRLRYLEKELNSQKDQAMTYKKKFEEISVEVGLLNETITYKDEKIKSDAERIKYYKSIEPEFAILRKTNKELEEACRILRTRADKIFEATTVEKEKWLAKEHGYYETINGLVKELNAIKNQEDDSGENSVSNKIAGFEKEIKSLKKELEGSVKVGEGLSEKNKEMNTKLKHVVYLLTQAEEILKCCGCYSTEKALGLIIPCLHLICKDCSGSKCKECYSSVHSVIHPGFVESFMYLLAQVKQYCKS